MKKFLYPFVALFVLSFIACKTAPAPENAPQDKPATAVPAAENTATVPGSAAATPAEPDAASDENVIVAQFDSVTITKQTFRTTKTEIQLVVEDLNRITFSKDYERWLTYLTEEYRQNFSDPLTLEKVSASLPVKGIQLKTLKDYFIYVFVPSRQNMRVDDIQFVSPTRVYVIMEIAPKSPAAIYILEKMSGGWKLVLKNQ